MVERLTSKFLEVFAAFLHFGEGKWNTQRILDRRGVQAQRYPTRNSQLITRKKFETRFEDRSLPAVLLQTAR